MGDRFERDEDGPSQPKRKSSGESNDENELEIGGQIETIEQTADIFKVDVDCLNELFDYLTLKDLISFGSTCKRFQRMAGKFFAENLMTKKAIFNVNGFYLANSNGQLGDKINCFRKFISKVEIKNSFTSRYLRLDDFRSLKQIEFTDVRFNSVASIKDILKNVEVLKLSGCDFPFDFNEHFLKYCTKLKQLHLDDTTLSRCWFKHTYPTLEYVQLNSVLTSTDELKTFFERNPNIRRFSTTLEFFMRFFDVNAPIIDAAPLVNVKWDDLAIKVMCREPSVRFYHFMDHLFSRNIFKGLHLHVISSWDLQQLDTLPAVVDLKICNPTRNQQSPPQMLFGLENLEELCIHRVHQITNFSDVLSHSMRLRRFQIHKATIHDIIPIISRLKNLRKLSVLEFEHVGEFTVINLPALNKIRHELDAAFKITIYVDESIYLATKLSVQQTEFDLIEIKRYLSYEWEHDF